MFINVDVKLFILHSTKSNITFTSDFDKIRNIWQSLKIKTLGDHRQNYKDKLNLLKDCREWSKESIVHII